MATEARMRIYVGGLGETVTEEDIRSTFAKLGEVEAVEFVRTKGRSFAYINFIPSSDKAVAKLFSTYNGCAWKGGKLRLQKAKEHYLERMKKEWAEDAELANKAAEGGAEDAVSLEGDKEALDPEITQIQMYFPKFRKVKSIPYKGSGKHKYSFRRVEVPPLPTHFCDCVEHAAGIHTVKETQNRHATIVEDEGVTQKELDMMNSVLNKFLEREPHPAVPQTSSRASPKADIPVPDHLPAQQNQEDDSTDDDGIVINAASGPTDFSRLIESMRQKTGSNTKIASSDKPQGSADVHPKNNIKGKGKHPTKKSKIVQREKSDEELEPFVPNTEQTQVNQSAFHESLGTKEDCSDKPGGITDNEAQPESSSADKSEVDEKIASLSNLGEHAMVDPEPCPPKPSSEAANADTDTQNVKTEKPSKGPSWTQKLPWMQLVGSANNSQFSLSQILPETKKPKQSQQVPSSQKTNMSNPGNESGLKRKRDQNKLLGSAKEQGHAASFVGFNLQPLNKKEQTPVIQKSETLENNLSADALYGDGSASASTSGNKPVEMKAFGSAVRVSETCPFMRTNSSMKEWMKAKAAVSGSLKKKK